MQVSIWILLDILLLLIVLLVFILIKLPNILIILNDRIKKTRKFIIENEGFFSIFFIGLFAIEQAILIIFTQIFDYNLEILKIIISIFALVVIGTSYLQKLILETKRKYEKETKSSLQKSTEMIESLKEFNRDLIEKIKGIK